MTLQVIPAGAPCWIDLMTSDLEKSKEFYTALFGWTYLVGDEEKYAGYTTAFKDGLLVAGFMQCREYSNGHPDLWTTYLRVDNIFESLEAAKNAGAIVYLEPREVPQQGKRAILADPGGAPTGLWELSGHTGFQAHEEPGASAWHELHSKDYDATVQFYAEVFGLKTTVMSDTAEFRYTNLLDGERELAGIMDAAAYLPHEAPSSWQVYFQTDDVDTAIAKALTLGATVVNTAEDSPYGRVAGLTDCTGALFKLVQPPHSSRGTAPTVRKPGIQLPGSTKPVS